ncbi:MAG: type IV pilus assembly protein PilM [Candidatus Omnitrophica bacterium]|nr:type IV pilus assembly protein PilM [Candidatus Omnitrophota bacterium]
MDYKKLFDQYLLLVNRFVPKPQAGPVIGIDIGTSSIKAVELGQVAGGLEIRHWAIEPLVGTDTKSALKKISDRLHLNSQLLVSSVFGKGTLIRYVDLPRMSLEDLRKAYIFDLDKYFPFDPKSIYTDCAILDPEGKDKKMSVLLAAVKREIVDERLKLFREAGLDLSRVMINSIATANAFSSLGPKVNASGKAKAVLDIGGSTSCIMIFKDFSPRFTRDIFVGSQELTRKIANALAVDALQAESIKRQPGEKLAQVIEACEMPINNLITEIRLSMDYFMTEKNIQVDELFLGGGGSLLKGIEGVFEKNLGMPVKIWNPLVNARLKSPAASGEIQTYAAQFGVALGLGL